MFETITALFTPSSTLELMVMVIAISLLIAISLYYTVKNRHISRIDRRENRIITHDPRIITHDLNYTRYNERDQNIRNRMGHDPHYMIEMEMLYHERMMEIKKDYERKLKKAPTEADKAKVKEDFATKMVKLKEQQASDTATKEQKEAQIATDFVRARKWGTWVILAIFFLADARIAWAIWQSFDATTFEIKAIKYGFLFVTFQFFIFSQGFGFSSIIKLVEAISSAWNRGASTPEKPNEKQ